MNLWRTVLSVFVALSVLSGSDAFVTSSVYAGVINQSPKKLIAPTAAGGEDWQLPTGEYETAKIPLEIIAPRAGLTSQNVYYRAYPGMPYQWPVGALGGSPPLHYRIVSGPAGLSVGESYGDANYGVMTWANPTTVGMPGGGWSAQIEVCDQEHNRPSPTCVTSSWTIDVGTTGWMFVDAVNGNPSPSNGGTATGTLADPFEQPDDFYITKHDTTYSANDIVVFRAGVYPFNQMPIENTQRITFTSAKPNVWMAYPGEQAVFDLADAHFNYEGGDNFALAGVTVRNAGEGATAAPKGIQWSGGYSDILLYANVFEQQDNGPAGENPSIMFANEPDDDIPGSYTVISHNVIQGTNDKDVLLVYFAHKGIFEWNDTANIERPIYLKSQFRYWSVRFNDGIDGTNTSEAFVRVDPYNTALDVEICYNNYQGTQGAVLAGYESGTVEIFDYRNTWQAPQNVVINSVGSWESTRNVSVHSATYNSTQGWQYWSGGAEVSEGSATLVPTRTELLHASSATGLINPANGLLIDANRTNFLYKRGHETH